MASRDVHDYRKLKVETISVTPEAQRIINKGQSALSYYQFMEINLPYAAVYMDLDDNVWAVQTIESMLEYFKFIHDGRVIRLERYNSVHIDSVEDSYHAGRYMFLFENFEYKISG